MASRRALSLAFSQLDAWPTLRLIGFNQVSNTVALDIRTRRSRDPTLFARRRFINAQSLEDVLQRRKDLIDHIVRRPFDTLATSSADVERARLIAKHDPIGLRAGTR